MNPKRLVSLPGKESLLIRICGVLVGVAFIVVFGILGWLGEMPKLQAVCGTFIGFVFVSYGLGGSKLLLKVLPSTYVRKI